MEQQISNNNYKNSMAKLNLFEKHLQEEFTL